MNLTRFVMMLIIVSSVAIGVSGCEWSGSGGGSSHFGGALTR